MLILSRRLNEKILIGEDVEIVIIDIKPGSTGVKLGITAPRGIEVDREEVRAKKLADRAVAAIGPRADDLARPPASAPPAEDAQAPAPAVADA